MTEEQPDTTIAIPAATATPSLPSEPTGHGTPADTPEDADLAAAFAKMEELARSLCYLGEPDRSFLNRLPADDADALKAIDRECSTYRSMMVDLLVSADAPAVDPPAGTAPCIASVHNLSGTEQCVDPIHAEKRQHRIDAIRALQAERREILTAGLSETDTRAAMRTATAAAAQRTNEALAAAELAAWEKHNAVHAAWREVREAYNTSERGVALLQHAEALVCEPLKRWTRAAVAWLETEERREAVAKKMAAGDGA